MPSSLTDEVLSFDEVVQFFAECRRALGEDRSEREPAASAHRARKPTIVKKQKGTSRPVTSIGRPQKRDLPPNVLRVDHSKAHGYWVRFRRNGHLQSKLFSDSVHGGWRSALSAATTWRNEKAETLPPKATHRQDPKPVGYSYIKRMLVTDSRSGQAKRFMAWVGFLRTENRGQVTGRWSVDKLGEEEAQHRAEAWLAKKVHELSLRLKATEKASKRPRPERTARKRMTQQALPFHDRSQTVVASSGSMPSSPPSEPPSSEPPSSRFRYDCGRCGGHIEKMMGPGRTYEHGGALLPIPDRFPTNTCRNCGTHYLSAGDRNSLETVLHLRHSALNGLATGRRRVTPMTHKSGGS